MTTTSHRDVFDLAPHVNGAFARRAANFLRPAIFKLLGLDKLEAIHGRLPAEAVAAGYIDALLAELGVSIRVSPEELERIPKTGPVVVVANHPFG